MREDQGRHRSRHRWRSGKMPHAHRGTRFRWRGRLQARRPAAQLHKQTPDRVDVFVNNVGGEVLKERRPDPPQTRRAGGHLRCGFQYNASGPVAGPANYMALLGLTRVDDGLCGFRLRQPVLASDRRAVRLGQPRAAAERRGHRTRRHRDVPEHARPPVHRPEHRQARPRTPAVTKPRSRLDSRPMAAEITRQPLTAGYDSELPPAATRRTDMTTGAGPLPPR